MPLIIPQTLPAYKALEEENVFVMHRARAMTQDIRPLRILLVNLMPTKIATETQIARMLANSPLQVELTLLHMDSHESTHVPGAHLEAFYKTFDEIKNERFDGMIVTGALRVLAESDTAGLHILATDSGRQIFVCGHMEYDRDTLRLEYERDTAKGLAIGVPENYFVDDDPAKGVIFRWRSHANLFFANWLNYYVYQETPYDLEKL